MLIWIISIVSKYSPNCTALSKKTLVPNTKKGEDVQCLL